MEFKPNRPSRKRSKDFSGNHQRSWLWGYHAVTETLTAGRWPVHAILATEAGYQQSADLLEAQVQQGIPLEVVEPFRLEELAKTTEHQGLLARMGPFPYADPSSLLEDLQRQVRSLTGKENLPHNAILPLVVLCDRIQDAFNFGAILRCCDGVNVAAVLVGERHQAEVTPHVARSSAGAVNHLAIAKCSNLLEMALKLKQIGFQVLAADSNATSLHWEAEMRSPTVLVIGSEAHGVAAELLAMCDQRLTIPMQGSVTSLNAAVAAGILLYEIRRQQR